MPVAFSPQPVLVASAPEAYVDGTRVGAALAEIQQRAAQGQVPVPAIKNPAISQGSVMDRAAQTVPNLSMMLRNTIDGQPVVPPGMTQKQASMYVSHDWMAQHIKEAKTLIFISMSQPKEDIRKILADVWAHKDLRDEAVVVVRGWEGDTTGLPTLVQEISSLQPGQDRQVNVAVDPMLFESLHIDRVPAVSMAETNGGWATMYGSQFLPSEAVKRMAQGKDFGKTYGKTWAIAEPDLIRTLNERMKAYNWQAKAQLANAQFFRDLPSRAPALPESPVALQMYHNPAVVVQKDIRLPDGRLVAKAGQVLNPLEDAMMPWSTWRAIVFNASVPWEVKQAKEWAARFPTARLMMADPPNTQKGYVLLEESFGRPVFVASPLVLGRLGVTNSPAMVWPDGWQLAIQVAPIPNDPALSSR
jgi:hypothetical protein